MRAEPVAVGVVSAWEAIALSTGLLPTWTSLVRPLPRRVRAVIAGAGACWLVVHFEVHRGP